MTVPSSIYDNFFHRQSEGIDSKYLVKWYKRLTNVENMWFFDLKQNKKKSKIQDCVHKLSTTPKVHFGKKHPITQFKILLHVQLMAGGSYSVEKSGKKSIYLDL